MLVPVNRDPLRRPHVSEAAPKDPTNIERETTERESTQERESEEAAKELEAYLKERLSGNRIGLRVESGERPPGDENWDDEPSFNTSHLIQAGITIPEKTKRRPSKGKASRYNSRRHLEADDVESVVVIPPQRRSSPPPQRAAWQPEPQRRCTQQEPRRRNRSPDRPARLGRSSRPDEAPRMPRPGSQPALPVRTTGVRFGNLMPIPTDPRIDPPPFRCYNCWQPGHDALQCARPQAMVFCHNCGRRGVCMAQCSRCSAEHERQLMAPPQPPAPRLAARRGSSHARAEPYARQAAPVMDRLGPSPNQLPQRAGPDEMQNALRILEGIRNYTIEVGEALLRRLYMCH